jgi:hypothetical protein
MAIEPGLWEPEEEPAKPPEFDWRLWRSIALATGVFLAALALGQLFIPPI